jgi:hypothetical protein
MERQPWEIYFDEFERRAARVPEQLFEREQAFSDAAHEAYRATADRLTREERWDDDRTLVITHAFGQTLKEWITHGDYDWGSLRERLRVRWEEWQGDSG